MYNPLGGPPGSQPDMNQQTSEQPNTSQGQQIQSMGASSAMTSVMPPGIQYLPAGPPPVGKSTLQLPRLQRVEGTNTDYLSTLTHTKKLNLYEGIDCRICTTDDSKKQINKSTVN